MTYSYLDVISEFLLNQSVEVYCGDSKQTVKFADFDMTNKSVIRGVIKDIKGDCLILECTRNNNKTLVFINSGVIVSIVPIGNILTHHIFTDEESSHKI